MRRELPGGRALFDDTRGPVADATTAVSDRAVVIGGTGQVGQAIAGRLHDAGWRVVVVARGLAPLPTELRVDGVIVRRADRTDPDALAAAIGDGTRLLVDCACFTAAHANGLRPLLPRVESTVLLSSKAVYVDGRGRHVNSAEPPRFDGPINESQATLAPSDTHDYASRSGYGAAKVAAERILLDDGHPVTVLRASKVHGPGGSRPHEWVFVKRVLDGRPAVLVSHRGRGSDHPTGAANLAALVETVAGRPGRRILNIADPDAPDGAAIAVIVAAHFEHSWRVVRLPEDADRMLGRHPWDRVPPIRLDLTAATELGYRPVGSYADTVGPTLDWLAGLARRGVDGHVLPAGFDVADIERMLDYAAEESYLATPAPAGRPPR